MLSTNAMPALPLVYLEPRAMHHYQYPSKPIILCCRNVIICYFVVALDVVLRFVNQENYKKEEKKKKTLTSTYETGNIPFWLATRPSNQLSSTRRVSTTNSPLCSDNSIADCAWKLNLARAWPSDGFFVGNRTPSFDIIWNNFFLLGIFKSSFYNCFNRFLVLSFTY